MYIKVYAEIESISVFAVKIRNSGESGSDHDSEFKLACIKFVSKQYSYYDL